jgi:F-type H+-transporting ATPase subunit b
MLTRLASYLFTFLVINKESFAAEEGMPQLDPEYWISQIFWLIIIFSFLYIFLSKMILPKISDTLEKRKLQISDNLEQAEKYKEDTQKKINEYEKILVEAKKDANTIMNEAKKKIDIDINSRKNQLDKQIEKEINEAEKEIKELKKTSIENINKIAIETSADLVKTIMNIELNKSNVSAIVEDVSRKKVNKHLW